MKANKINSVKKKRCLDLTHVETPAKQLELLQQALETRVDWLKYKTKRSACNYYLHQKGTSTLDVSAENNVVVKQFDGRSDFVELICSNTTTVGKSFERSNSFTRKVSSISFLKDRTKRENFIKIMDNLNTMSLEPAARHIMENKIINRLSMLKSKGLLSTSRIPRCIEPLQKQTTEQDLLLEQMHWYFTDIISDRKLRLSTYKKINNSVIKHFNTLEKQKMIQEKEAIVHRKKLASAVSKEILIFWKNIHKVLRYKQKLITKTEQQEALNEHLHILIDQSRQYISTLANNNRLHDENLFDTNINNANLTSPDISSVANFKQPRVLVDIPILIKHTLREYQHVGLDWLSRLYKAKLNGILADEMGLGKTIQTIAFLAHLACAKGIWGPFLIIVPTSVMLNWELEFKKWCPAFKILTYYGTAKERKDKRKGWTTLNAFHVCVTSYMLACRDALVFRRVKWKMLVLDEAQNIKNFKSQRWQSLLSFNASRRLLLTGTPLQNSVMELWSFMHFLMPKFFTSHDEFNLWFSTPLMNMIEGNTSINEELISQFHQILRPFILRRLKSEVEKQMPKKFEHIITAKLSKRQRCLYDEFIHSAITQETIRSGHYVSVIGVLMQLRKVCNHPDLFEPRSITSPFATVPISYHVPKDVVNCLNFSIPTAHSSIGFCSAEFNQSSFDCLRARVLAVNRSWYEDIALPADTNSDLLRQHIQPITNFKDFAIFEYLANHELRQNDVDLHLENLNSIKLPGSPLIKGNDSMNLIEEIVIRRKQRILDSIESFSRTQCLKSLRSLFKPIYGKDLIELVSFISHNLYIDQSAFDDIELNRYYLNLLNVVADIIENGEAQRLIDSFHLYVPTVIATPISLISSAAINNVESDINIRVSLPYNLPLIQFPDRQFIQHDSGKLRVLRVLLQRLQRDQHRVVMFSQMTRMLDILETFLSSNSMTYLRLDGSTKIEKRQVLVKTFNQDKRIFCFILSTRSGGIGINLTGADTVIFYDSDWNPTSDAQAQDRCHRIGQTRDVHIYRLVSEFTVEENILKKATQKRILGNVAIDGLSTNTLYKKQSIKELFDLPDIITTSSEDILNNDSVPYKTDSTPEDKQFVQALELVEDESDVHALKSARDEAALEELEFRDDVDNLNDKTDVISIAQDAEIEVCKRKLEFLNQELSSIEKFALRYAENHQDMFTLSRTQLNQMTKVDNIRKECELSKLRSVNFPNIEKDIDSLSNNSEDIEQQLSIESALRKEKVSYMYLGYSDLCSEINFILSDNIISNIEDKYQKIFSLIANPNHNVDSTTTVEVSTSVDEMKTIPNRKPSLKKKEKSVKYKKLLPVTNDRSDKNNSEIMTAIKLKNPIYRKQSNDNHIAIAIDKAIKSTNAPKSSQIKSSADNSNVINNPQLASTTCPQSPSSTPNRQSLYSSIIHNSNIINISPTVNTFYIPAMMNHTQPIVAPSNHHQLCHPNFGSPNLFLPTSFSISNQGEAIQHQHSHMSSPIGINVAVSNSSSGCDSNTHWMNVQQPTSQTLGIPLSTSFINPPTQDNYNLAFANVSFNIIQNLPISTNFNELNTSSTTITSNDSTTDVTSTTVSSSTAVWTVFVPELNTYVEIQPYGDFNDIINNTYAGNYVVSDIKSLYEYPEDFAYLLDTVDPVYYDEDDHSDKDCDSFEVENDNSNGEISDLDKNTNGALQKCIKPPAKFRQRMPSYRSSRKATKAVSQLKELVYKYSSHRRSATKANQQSVKLSEYEMENMHKASKFLVRVKKSRQLANVHGLSEFMNNNSYESYCGTRRWKRWYASDDIRRCKETRSLCLVTVKLDSPIVLKESLVSDEVKCQQSNSHTSFTLNASLLAQKPLTNSTSKNKVYRSSFSKTTAHNQGILWGSLLRNFKDKPKRTRNVNQKTQGQPRPDSIQASVLTKATNLMPSPSPTQSNSMRFPSHNEIQINQTGIQCSLDQNHQNMVDSNPQYKYQLTQSNSQNQQDHQQHLYIQVSKAYQPLHISHRTNDGNGYDQQQVRSMNVRPENSLSDQQQRFVIPTALYPMERATDIDESHSDKVIPIQHNISHAQQTRIMQPPSTKQTYFQKFRAHINQLTPDNLGFAVRPIQSLPNSIRPLINQQTYTTSTECSQSNHTDPVRSSSYPSLIPTTSVSPIISDQFRSHESKSISQALQQNQLSSAVPHLTSRSKYSDILQMSALQLKAATDRQQIQQQNQQQIINAVNSNAQLINISSHNIPEQIKHKLSTRSPSIPTRQISADQRNQTHNYQDLQPRSQQRPQISTQLAYDAFRTSSQPMQRTLSNFSLFNEKSSDHVPKMSMSTTHYLPNKSSDVSHSVASVYNDSPIYNTATTRLPSIETLKRPRLSDTYNSKTSFSLPSCPQPVQSAQSYRYVTVQNRNLPNGRLHLNAAASSRNLRPQQRTKALSHRIQNFGVNFRPVSLTFAHESDGTQPLPSMSATSTGIRSFRSSSSNLPYNCVSNSGCQPLVQSIVSKSSLPPGHRSQLPRLKQLNNNARNLTEHFIKQHYPYRLPPATKEDKQI
ncbi:hypothetical protein GJ496_000588 [Pomphorhynchus laevis]|nr:hypothetical protein GJ496_000588 [Pomphorhynchus laevis]